MDAFLRNLGPDNVVAVAYHMNWPGAGNDPFYVNNPTENYARRTYYGVSYVPDLRCDGILGGSASQFQTYYNQRTGVASPVSIALTVTGGATLNVSAAITAESYYTGTNLRLRVALICKSYDIPPGSWTYTHFEWGMIDMVPDANGLSFSISPGQTVNLNTSCPSPTYPPTTPDNFAFVAFVQNESSHEVLQAKYGPIPIDFPSLSLTNFTVTDDAPGGNGNGLPEPGETCQVWVELANAQYYATATTVSADLSTDDPDITVTTGTATFPDIPGGGTGNNQSNPYVFEVSPQLEAHIVTFDLDIACNGGAYTFQEQFSFMVGVPTLLLVDDDAGQTYETYFTYCLDQLNAAYNVWDVNTQGSPTPADLSLYETVIWSTGMTTVPLSFQEQETIMNFLNNHGKLFISSENLSDNLGTSPFFTNYMHAAPGTNHIVSTTLVGVTGDPISNGTTIILVGGAYWPDSQSVIYPDSSAFPIFRYTNPAQDCGALRYIGNYMLVYTAFPFECIATNPTSYTPRTDIMEGILEWLDTGVVMAVSLPDTSGDTDSHIAIPVNIGMVDPASGVTSYDFELQWDSAVLELDTPFVTLTGTITPGDWTGDFTSSAPGQLSVSASGTTALSGEGVLAWINFHITGAVQATTVLDLVSFSSTNPLIYDITDGSLTVTGMGCGDLPESSIPTKFEIASIVPNPFNPMTSIVLNIPREGWVEVGVYNLLGAKVAEVYSDVMSPGQHTLSFNGEHLASGIYIVKASSNDGIQMQKMVLMK